VLLTLAYLAKPVAVLALAPLFGLVLERIRGGRTTPAAYVFVMFVLPLAVLWWYDRALASHAEWHWASGIARLHVLPALQSAFGSPAGFAAKLAQLRMALAMMRDTLLGSVSFTLSVLSFAALPWVAARSKALLWGWLAGGLLYTYVVVTVERVDYYLYPLLPLCALVAGGATARFVNGVRGADLAPTARGALLAIVPALALTLLIQSPAPVAAYYRYNKQVYRNAVYLDGTLPKNALVVIGHYGPDVQYYIDRFGWEEDPALWTPFDEESAIRKGARYFISIEDNRLRRNLELCAWLQRFPILNSEAAWPVYVTNPAGVTPRDELFWRRFRAAERAGIGRAFLDAHHRCLIKLG